VTPMLPVEIGSVCEVQISFVYQVRDLQSLPRILISETASGEAAKFTINPGNQGGKRLPIAAGPGAKQLRGFGSGGVFHPILY
jgi:hypothetical protein